MALLQQFYTLDRSVTVPAYGGGLYVRIGENARKCVIFFGTPGEGAEQENIEYGGTGFFVALEQDDWTFTYLVTCRHVAEALKAHEGTGFYVRLNNKIGESTVIPLGKIEWSYPTDPTIDLAAVGVRLRRDTFDHIFLRIGGCVDRRENGAVSEGDDISIVGLFHPHAGTSRNIPLVHSGNISVLADPNERVPVKDRNTGHVIKSEAYLVEAQTLDGCSGAPAFLHELVSFAFVEPLDHAGTLPKAYGVVKLLGVYSGSWDGEPGELLATDRRLGPNRKVPVGIGTVIPVDLLVDFLEGDEKLKKRRDDAKDASASSRAAIQDSALPPPRSTDENPNHREDFTSLANAAARKQKQDE